MRGPVYTADFFKGEVERLTLVLTQSITLETRVQYLKELAAAQSHLTDLTKK